MIFQLETLFCSLQSVFENSAKVSATSTLSYQTPCIGRICTDERIPMAPKPKIALQASSKWTRNNQNDKSKHFYGASYGFLLRWGLNLNSLLSKYVHSAMTIVILYGHTRNERTNWAFKQWVLVNHKLWSSIITGLKKTTIIFRFFFSQHQWNVTLMQLYHHSNVKKPLQTRSDVACWTGTVLLIKL